MVQHINRSQHIDGKVSSLSVYSIVICCLSRVRAGEKWKEMAEEAPIGSGSGSGNGNGNDVCSYFFV